jgi:hypothetical protein
MSTRTDQVEFQAAPAQDIPFQGCNIRNEHLIENIDWLYCGVNTPDKLVIGGGIFSFQDQRRPEEATPPDRLGR